MLLPVIFIVALMLTLATAMLENSLAAAKITLHAAVARYSDVAISDGVADFTGALASSVQKYGLIGSWPSAVSHSYPKSLCDASIPLPQCPFSYTIAATITDASDAATASDTHDTARNLQTSVINEQRLSAVITATISAQNGTVLGTHTRLLTYRLFAAAPYAIVSGSTDTTSVNGSRALAPGDNGGAPPPALQTAAQGEPSSDTRIHVQLECNNTGGNDGLAWGNNATGALQATCPTKASSADAFADRTWTNGNANASGWTQ